MYYAHFVKNEVSSLNISLANDCIPATGRSASCDNIHRLLSRIVIIFTLSAVMLPEIVGILWLYTGRFLGLKGRYISGFTLFLL